MGKLPVSIKQIYRKIQIPGKGDPEQIGEHKPARRFEYTEKSEHCQENKYPEGYDLRHDAGIRAKRDC